MRKNLAGCRSYKVSNYGDIALLESTSLRMDGGSGEGADGGGPGFTEYALSGGAKVVLHRAQPLRAQRREARKAMSKYCLYRTVRYAGRNHRGAYQIEAVSHGSFVSRPLWHLYYEHFLFPHSSGHREVEEDPRSVSVVRIRSAFGNDYPARTAPRPAHRRPRLPTAPAAAAPRSLRCASLTPGPALGATVTGMTCQVYDVVLMSVAALKKRPEGVGWPWNRQGVSENEAPMAGASGVPHYSRALRYGIWDVKLGAIFGESRGSLRSAMSPSTRFSYRLRQGRHHCVAAATGGRSAVRTGFTTGSRGHRVVPARLKWRARRDLNRAPISMDLACRARRSAASRSPRCRFAS